jgi:hypothetical protein
MSVGRPDKDGVNVGGQLATVVSFRLDLIRMAWRSKNINPPMMMTLT